MKKFFALMLVAAAFVLVTAGCGGDAPAVKVDKAPFEQAIAQYCKDHSYGMKVKELINLQPTGDTATGIFKMIEASGLYGMAVKWEFKFKKTDGKWQVVSHEAR